MKPAPAPRWVRLLRSIPLLGVPFFAILISPAHLTDTNEALAAQIGGADAFVLDADPTGNTATSLGAIQSCARIDQNGVQDADEDAVDSVNIDLAAVSIPSVNPAVGFSATVNSPPGVLAVTGASPHFLLGSLPGSSVFAAADPTPDSDGVWTAGAVDIGSAGILGPYETGSGVLSRITIGTGPAASAGLHTITLTGAGHIDPENVFPPDVLSGASIAIDTDCTSDADADGVNDVDEAFCGAAPLNAASRPERVDAAFAGLDDDGDGQTDEALPALAAGYDCDGDGFSGSAEARVFGETALGDQDPCGANATPPTNPPSPAGWPADLHSASGSANKVNLTDITSFVAPTRYLGTDVGTNPGDARWDLRPGDTVFSADINAADLAALVTLTAPMLDGERAFGGPPCPWP